MIWRAQITDVRPHSLGLRWALRCWTPDLETMVWVDSTHGGTILGVQSDGYIGHTGDETLDALVTDKVREVLASRAVARQLDALDRRRWGPGPRERLRRAA